MSNVISIDANKPHLGGPARCLSCRHEWHAVVVAGSEQSVGGLECPSCSLSKGEFIHNAAPTDSTLIFQCNCGYDMFFVTLDGVFCPGCGARHNAGDLWS